MKQILEPQNNAGGAVLETQSNTLPDDFVANPRRVTKIAKERRIAKIKREKRIVKSMPKISYEFDHAFGAVLDYGFDWTDSTWWAAGDTIATSTWASSVGYAIVTNESNINGVVAMEPQGMLKDKIYRFTNTVVTAGGKTDSRTLVISCKTR